MAFLNIWMLVRRDVTSHMSVTASVAICVETCNSYPSASPLTLLRYWTHQQWVYQKRPQRGLVCKKKYNKKHEYATHESMEVLFLWWVIIKPTRLFQLQLRQTPRLSRGERARLGTFLHEQNLDTNKQSSTRSRWYQNSVPIKDNARLEYCSYMHRDVDAQSTYCHAPRVAHNTVFWASIDGRERGWS